MPSCKIRSVHVTVTVCPGTTTLSGAGLSMPTCAHVGRAWHRQAASALTPTAMARRVTLGSMRAPRVGTVSSKCPSRRPDREPRAAACQSDEETLGEVLHDFVQPLMGGRAHQQQIDTELVELELELVIRLSDVGQVRF